MWWIANLGVIGGGFSQLCGGLHLEWTPAGIGGHSMFGSLHSFDALEVCLPSVVSVPCFVAVGLPHFEDLLPLFEIGRASCRERV